MAYRLADGPHNGDRCPADDEERGRTGADAAASTEYFARAAEGERFFAAFGKGCRSLLEFLYVVRLFTFDHFAHAGELGHYGFERSGTVFGDRAFGLRGCTATTGGKGQGNIEDRKSVV